MDASASRQPEPASAGKHRIVALDVLRGFALFGILFVNVMGFSGVRSLGAGEGGIDNLVYDFMTWFAQGKFMTLFALLFGIGFTLQAASLERQGVGLFPVYWRRLAVLFAIGLLHTRLEPAEVLALYALCGAVLIAFRGLPWKAVLLVAVVVMALPQLHTAIVTPVYVADQAAAPAVEESADETAGAVEADEEEMHPWNPYMGDLAVRIHSSGTFSEFTSYNHRFTARRWTTSWVNYLWMTIPLPVMMLGMLIGRSGFLGRIYEERRRLTWIFGLGLTAGTGLVALANVFFDLAGANGWNPWLALPGGWSFRLSGVLTAGAYAAGILLLLQRPVGALLTTILAPVGRLALTNYLMQTVICTSLFFGYGLGLYGKVSAAEAALIGVAVFAFQVMFSRLWLNAFSYGPTEWLWRTVTYWRRLPLATG